MYRINTANGEIFFPDNTSLKAPYDSPMYLVYASWVQAGNSPEEFYQEPVAEVPNEVLRFQFRVALLNAGYLSAVETYMASNTTASGIVWKDLDYFTRNSNIVEEIKTLLSLTSTQMDDLFRSAALITA